MQPALGTTDLWLMLHSWNHRNRWDHPGNTCYIFLSSICPSVLPLIPEHWPKWILWALLPSVFCWICLWNALRKKSGERKQKWVVIPWTPSLLSQEVTKCWVQFSIQDCTCSRKTSSCSSLWGERGNCILSSNEFF